MTAGDLDMGLAIQGPVKNAAGQNRFTMIGGMKVPSGKDVDRLVREHFAQIPSEKGATLKLDVAKGPNGTAIHHLSVPEASLDPKLVKQCGSAGLFLAFPGNTLLISFGDEGLNSIQQAIENLARSQGEGTEPAALQTHLSALGSLPIKTPKPFARPRQRRSQVHRPDVIGSPCP